MLLQRHPSHIRLISQHQHALLCGALALAWTDFPNLSHPLPTFDTLLAITLHDHPWHAFDLHPTLQPKTPLPHHFLSVAIEQRLQLYTDGLDLLETTHPLTALLVSLHYTTLSATRGHTAYQRNEAARRERIAALYSIQNPETELHKPLSLLRFLDLLSLYACMTPPPVTAHKRPPWLMPQGRGRLPNGDVLQATWTSPNHLVLDPFPLQDTLTVPVIVRDLPHTEFHTQQALDEAWGNTKDSVWNLTFAAEALSAA